MQNQKSNPLEIKLEQGYYKIKLSPEKFFKALFNSLLEMANINVGDAIKQFLGVIKIEKNENVIATELVFKPLLQAMYQLVFDEYRSFKTTAEQRELKFDVEDLIEEIIIDENFFFKPLKQSFLKQAQKIYKDFLVQYFNETEAKAKQFANLLPDRYLYELIKEWNNKPNDYEALLKKFTDNPFYEQWKKRQNIQKYYTVLKKDYLAPALGDKLINLNEVYILQNFKIFKECFPKDYEFENKDNDTDGFISANRKIDIHDFFENYFLKREQFIGGGSEKSRFLLLLGQPGQGKTSFCARTAVDLIDKYGFNENLFIIKLRYLYNPQHFIEQPLEEIRKYLEKKYKVEFTEENTLLILDGLDELYMTADLTNENIIKLFRTLQRELENETSLKIVITSRYNYVDIEKISHSRTLIVKLEELSLEQQLEWLKKYKTKYPDCKLDEEKLKEINNKKHKQYSALRELVSQPILLHIVARANFEINKNYNRSALYDKLFDALTNRKWSKDGKLTKFEKIEPESLRNYISAIALRIYQSPYGYITRYELINNLEETKEFINDHNLNIEDLNDGLKEILVNFYFRNVERDEDLDGIREDKSEFAVEFLHKSLQEFLAAERIYKLFKDEFLDKNRKQKYIINDWLTALELVWKILSHKKISNELREYLIEIINNDTDTAGKKELADRMAYFFDDLLKKQFIYKYEAKTDDDYPLEKAITVFYGYWLIMKELDKKRNFITEDNKHDFAKLLRTSYPTVGYGIFDLSYQNLSGVNFSLNVIAGSDLRNADLRNADLSDATLSDANLSHTDISGADLSGVNLCCANLIDANLIGAYLNDANLNDAKLSDADLSGVNLSDAELRNADLSDANLRRINLNGANLRNADLSNANLRNADLSNAKLIDADLSNAKLIDAKLIDAKLIDAKLIDADLSGAILIKANLCCANLSGADLSDADLSDANLSGANLSNVDLSRAKLSGAQMNKRTITDGVIGISEEEIEEMKKRGEEKE